MNFATENGGVSPRGLRGARVVVLVCLVVLWSALVAAGPALAAPVASLALTPSSSSVDFFSQDMHNQSAPMTVTYTSSVASTQVQPASIIGPDASNYSIQQDFCANQTLLLSQSCSVSVMFMGASGPGLKTATLRLVDDTGTTDVALSTTAITGTVSADQNSLDFGGLVVNQGNSNQQHVTISNGPTAGVIITNVQIVGTDASSFNIQNNNCQNQGTFGPGNSCQVYIQFQPTSTGSQHALLEINNDGTSNPLFVPLTGAGLNGPVVTISPSQAIYGNVTLGSQSSQTFTVTDTGDAPLQIQVMFLVAGSPQVFPISNNNCSGRQISAGSSCQVTVGFVPIAVGDKDASLLLITNNSNPGVTTIGLDGTGVAPAAAPTAIGSATSSNPAPAGSGTAPNPAPTGSARVIGSAQAGKRLSCATVAYPPITSFSYQWLRDGRPISGAIGRTLSLGDADLGARLACRVNATTLGQTQTVTTSPTATTSAQLTLGRVSLHGFTINARLTVSRGKLSATGRITNPQAVSSAGCKAGHALVKYQAARCVLTSFGARRVTIRTGNVYTVSLSPNAAARKALNAGHTLRVKETITLSTAGGLKPIRKAFNVTIHSQKAHPKHG